MGAICCCQNNDSKFNDNANPSKPLNPDSSYYRKNFKGTEKDKDYFYQYQRHHSEIQPLMVRRSVTVKDMLQPQLKRKLSIVERKQIAEEELQRSKTINLETIVKENIQINYKFEKTLGEGAYGKVKIASLRYNDKKKFAIKSIPREILDQAGKEKKEQMMKKYKDEETLNLDLDEELMQELLESEIKVLMNMDHPNIVKFYQCVYDNNYMNIVMELIDGIPLSNYVVDKGTCTEEETRVIIYDIMCAMKYYQAQGIVHRDLKLDNILVVGHDTGNLKDLRVKIIDFGMSKIQKKHDQVSLSTQCGTVDFTAPEILEGKDYDKKCDIWSAGVIAFFLLAGVPPFLGKDDKEIKQKILMCDFDYNLDVWKNDSLKDLKNWIDKTIEPDIQARYSPEQALDHKWLNVMATDPLRCKYKIHPFVILNLRECNKPCRLHYILLTLFTQFLQDDDIQAIRETFQYIDKDQSGSVDLSELKACFQQMSMKDVFEEHPNSCKIDNPLAGSFLEKIQINNSVDIKSAKESFKQRRIKENRDDLLSGEQIDQILDKIDTDKNGQIEYSEFLTHALGRRQLSEENIRSFFSLIKPARYGLEFGQAQEQEKLHVSSSSEEDQMNFEESDYSEPEQFEETDTVQEIFRKQANLSLRQDFEESARKETIKKKKLKSLEQIGEYINAKSLKLYFQKSGKIESTKEIMEMMDEVEQECGIPGFNGHNNILFADFYQFMTSFISEAQDDYFKRQSQHNCNSIFNYADQSFDYILDPNAMDDDSANFCFRESKISDMN